MWRRGGRLIEDTAVGFGAPFGIAGKNAFKTKWRDRADIWIVWQTYKNKP